MKKVIITVEAEFDDSKDRGGQYFTPENITRIFEQHGFNHVKVNITEATDPFCGHEPNDGSED